MNAKTWVGALFLLVFLAGAGLRLHLFSDQVMVYDEVHAPAVAMKHGYLHIATHFHRSDNCIPLTLAYKAMMDTVGLTENRLRLPQLVFGILVLLAFPRMARAVLKPGENLLFLTLLAISPFLFLFSRYARPYIITTLFSVAALAAFAMFFRFPRPRWAVLYCLGAVLASWSHLLALPFVLAPPVYAFFTILLRPRVGRRPSMTAVLIPAMVALALVAALHAAAYCNTGSSLTDKLMSPRFSLSTFSEAVNLFAGVTNPWVGAGVLAVAVSGAAMFTRREPWLGGCMIFTALAQIAAILVAAPEISHVYLVFARYNLWVLPLVLFFFAVGAAAPGSGPWKALPAGAALLALLWFSPLPRTLSAPNSFTNHPRFGSNFAAGEFWHRRLDAVQYGVPSAFYHLLAREPGECLVAEAPWNHHTASYLADLQTFHRKRVVVGILDPGDWLPLDGRFRFRNLLDATDCGALRQRGVKYLILHKRARGHGAGGPDPMDRLDPAWRRAFGPPIHEDALVRVYLVTKRAEWLGPVKGPFDFPRKARE